MKRHPYITATLIATLFALVVWICVPKEYTATTKLSDEYQETELAIGFSLIQKKIKDWEESAKADLNDMEVYCKVLKAEDFVRKISQKQVYGKKMTYGEYIGEKDTIEVVKNHINYNYSNRQETLIIGFTDREATVASMMLDSVTVELQQFITQYRHKIAKSALEDAKEELNIAKKQYIKAMNAYTSYADTHHNTTDRASMQKEKSLEKEMLIAEEYFQKVSTAYVRQQALLKRSYCAFAVIQDNTVPLHYDNHLIGYILSFIVLALIFTWFIYQYKKRKKEGALSLDFGNLFSPWNITISIWGIMLLLLSANTILEPISSHFYICLFIWLCVFCPSSLATYNLLDKKGNTQHMVSINVNMTLFNFMFVLAMCMTPLYIYEVYKLVAMFDARDILNNIRELSVHGDGFGFLNLTLVIDVALLIVALLLYPKIPTWKLILIILAWVVYCIGTMAKVNFFMLFIFAIYAMYEKKHIKFKTIVIASSFLIVFFYFFNLMRAGDDSAYREEESFIDFVGMYIMSGPAAFGHVMEGFSDKFSPNVFWFVDYYVGRFFTGEQIIHTVHKDFVFVPISTNTYTIFRPYYIDFGYWGIGMFALVYGTIYGYLYRLSVNQNPWGKCFYCFMLFFLAMQFFDDMITDGPMVIIQVAILTYLVCYDSKNQQIIAT